MLLSTPLSLAWLSWMHFTRLFPFIILGGNSKNTWNIYTIRWLPCFILWSNISFLLFSNFNHKHFLFVCFVSIFNQPYRLNWSQPVQSNWTHNPNVLFQLKHAHSPPLYHNKNPFEAFEGLLFIQFIFSISFFDKCNISMYLAI